MAGLNLKNPWWIVAGSTTALMVANGPVLMYTSGVFFKPLAAEFGVSRGDLSATHMFSSFVGAAMLPLVGMAMDRWGVRRVLLPAIALYALTIVALGASPTFVAFALLWTLCGITGSAQSPISYVKSISAFFEERRGLALGIAMAGVGVGAAMMPQIAQALIDQVGWRYAYMVIAAGMAVLAIPAVWLFVQEPASAAGVTGTVSSDVLPGMHIAEAIRSRPFWLLVPSVLMVSTVVNGSMVHVVPLLTDRGYTPTAAAQMMMAVGFSTMAGRLISGYLVDRIFAPYVAAFFFTLCVGGLGLLASGHAPLLGIIALGLAAGTEIDLVGFLTSRYFGQKRFGQIYGYLFAAFAMGAGLGPALLGMAYDRLGSYVTAFLSFGGLMIVALGLLLALGPYVYPVVHKPAKARGRGGEAVEVAAE
ncbi:MFS transporter [Phenylobacterium sp.]|uniref:MFS transporter n=1 Tax=Phenylobacterium sp. TaxID=1871053 RepID=UPI0027345CB8|nr:MFS transporter [Phenylobacterium sp.]MDP3658679.1 MFS transporter [Phenylobacterium sp.]